MQTVDTMIDNLISRYSRHVEFIGESLTNVNQVGVFGSQIIHLASFSGRADDVKEMIPLIENINSAGDLGLTALHYAVLGGHPNIIRILVSAGAKMDLENEFGETAAQMAHIMGNSEIENLLIDLGASPAIGFDGGSIAKERWADFKVIQEGNFWQD